MSENFRKITFLMKPLSAKSEPMSTENKEEPTPFGFANEFYELLQTEDANLPGISPSRQNQGLTKARRTNQTFQMTPKVLKVLIERGNQMVRDQCNCMKKLYRKGEDFAVYHARNTMLPTENYITMKAKTSPNHEETHMHLLTVCVFVFGCVLLRLDIPRNIFQETYFKVPHSRHNIFKRH